MKKLWSALALTVLLTATINSESLWTDEAFSAYIASHHTIATCWSTLLHGDPSDLQMILYYLYLHGWSVLFGQSEIAFRSANIPFIILYASVLVWASHRLFRSNWAWILAALSPLAVTFASDTRAYFDVIALSLTCVACLLAWLQEPTPRERQILPWLVLSTLLLGALFHMLMLLLGPPLAVLLFCIYRKQRAVIRIHWVDWKWPLFTLVPLGCLLLAYFAWTFTRSIGSSNYSKPDLLSMGSVIFRFGGLSGFAPNRRYDIPFRPYLLPMALSTIALVAGVAALVRAQVMSTQKVVMQALLAALITGLVEAAVLSLVIHQQIEFRHLSCLLPLLSLLIMAGLQIEASTQRKLALCGAISIGIAWLTSDIILLASPYYKREDYRSAVSKVRELHRETNAPIAIVADPVAPAYYGLDMQGQAPCFPLTDSCPDGFAKVPWPKDAPAEYAVPWSPARVQAWLATNRRVRLPSIVLISGSRHTIIKESAWWPILNAQKNVRIYKQFGFYVYLVP